MLWILKRLVWIFTRPERQREVEACTIYYTILCKKVKWYFKQSHSLGKFRHAPRTNGASEWFWHLLMFISLYVCKSENLTVSYLYQILELNRQVFLSKRVSPTQQLQQRKGKKVWLCGLLSVFVFCLCQSFHSASQHQWLRWLSLQVCGGVAGVHQDEPVQWKLQHSRDRQHGTGAADEKRVSNAKFPSFQTFSTLYKGSVAVNNQMRSRIQSKVHFCRIDFCFAWCVISWCSR